MEPTPKSLHIQRTVTNNPMQHDFPMHTHHFCELYYFISGKGVFHIEGNDYSLKSGDILIMNDTESHYIEIDPSQPYERMVIHFNKDFVKILDPSGKLLEAFENRLPGENNLFRNNSFDNNLYQMLIDNMLSSLENRLQIETNFFALLNELKTAYSKSTSYETENALPNKIANYILDNLENEFTLEDICKEFYISKPQLCRIFKKSIGSTIWNYVTIKRLARAKALIDNGLPPTHAYVRCGFTDYSCFYRAYKKVYETSPSKFKNLNLL